jgi:hypothetical protein
VAGTGEWPAQRTVGVKQRALGKEQGGRSRRLAILKGVW